MKKVSVIIPVYNVEKYLRRCLNSVLRQTYDDYEIICINDKSPDNSDKILAQYVRKFPDKISVYTNEENLGSGRTRERGLRHAEGEYVMFIDGDDYIKSDYIEAYVSAMENGSYDMVIGGYIRDVEGKKKSHHVSDSIWSVLTYPVPWAKIFKKSFILDNHIEFSDIRCGEDIYFSLSLAYHNVRYKVINYAGYYYYFNKKSTMGSMDHSKNHEQFVASIYSRFMKKHDMARLDKDIRYVIEYSYIANMVNALITYDHGAGIKLMKQKYEYVMRELERKFPNYKENPHIGILKPKGQTLKIRMGVGVTMLLNRAGLDRLMFYAIALV
ncbi:MAG: glycosyltransferase [Clostridium sp.]|nr:glycosyltransferase [Clostridium sp.]MCM1173243.1 glycosyltransferase [Clostridium sp.]MCM1208355.1 glycosyltransferase [Ruminococcus sp.]